MHTIKLSQPVTVNNIKHDALTLRRPKVKDRLALEHMKKTDAEKEITMIANLANIEPEVIEELDLADYTKVQQVLVDFLEQKPKNSV